MRGTLPERECHSASVIDDKRIYLFGGATYDGAYHYYDDTTLVDTGTQSTLAMCWPQLLITCFSEHAKCHTSDARTSPRKARGTLRNRAAERENILVWRRGRCGRMLLQRLFHVRSRYVPTRRILYRWQVLTAVMCVASITWSRTATSGRVPPARAGHSAVLLGHKLYIYGGYNSNGTKFFYFSDMYRLDIRK